MAELSKRFRYPETTKFKKKNQVTQFLTNIYPSNIARYTGTLTTCLSSFPDKYVPVPANKASNNVVFEC